MKHTAADSDVLFAARVSTAGEQSLDELQKDPERSKGLINYLMRDRHGSPFEHNSMTFFISAPIFVFREFMRHRVGWSYNEESGRYRELQPVFYVPGESRKLVQEGRPGKYVFVEGTQAQHKLVGRAMEDSYRQAYEAYQEMLAAGVAREVARAVLPVGLFSSMYATCNARSLMHFLGLRTQHELAQGPVLPAAGDRDGRREDGGGSGPSSCRSPTPPSMPTAAWRRSAPRTRSGTDVRISRAKCPYCGVSRSSSRLIKRTRHCLNPRAGSAGLLIVRLVAVPRGQTTASEQRVACYPWLRPPLRRPPSGGSSPPWSRPSRRTAHSTSTAPSGSPPTWWTQATTA